MRSGVKPRRHRPAIAPAAVSAARRSSWPPSVSVTSWARPSVRWFRRWAGFLLTIRRPTDNLPASTIRGVWRALRRWLLGRSADGLERAGRSGETEPQVQRSPVVHSAHPGVALTIAVPYLGSCALRLSGNQAVELVLPRQSVTSGGGRSSPAKDNWLVRNGLAACPVRCTRIPPRTSLLLELAASAQRTIGCA